MPAVDEVDSTLRQAGRTTEDNRLDLRTRTARGTLINGTFLVGITVLGLVQGTLVTRLLPPSVIGKFELLMAAFMTVLALGQVGVDDKYIQQNDPDQQKAFETAFTLQWVVAGALAVLMLVGIPAFAELYRQPSLIGPGLALIATLPALALQMPLWAHYRRMDFARQRKLQFINAMVMFVTIVALLAAGLKLWALVAAGLAASWVTAAVTVRSSPYRLRVRWDRAAFRDYTSFSWPLFLNTIATILSLQVPVIVSARLFGVAAVAGIALAVTISQFTTRVDDVVTVTLYPAICAVKDRVDLLFESFWKSNRLALLWAAPLGCAGALFAGDFVHYVIGEKWRFAVPLIAITLASAAINQIGFNWSAFYRAIGKTRPMAVTSTVRLVATLGIAMPLLAVDGVTGFAIGFGIVTVIAVTVRGWYLLRLFPGLAMTGHILRGFAPTVPAATVVIVVRLAAEGARTPARVALEAVLFVAVAAVATYLSQRELLRESLNYLRRRAAPRLQAS